MYDNFDEYEMKSCVALCCLFYRFKVASSIEHFLLIDYDIDRNI